MNSSTPPEGDLAPEEFDWSWTTEGSDWVPPAIDPTKVSAARIYDFMLGGKDNFEVDRAAARRLLQRQPVAKELARANRRFLQRAVHHLVRDHGIRQFIDLGTGIPTSPSLHEIARKEATDVRVVYVDNDPVVLAHTRALLDTEPRTATLLRDLRDPDTVLDDPVVRQLIDFERPVALMLVAVLHFVSVEQAPTLLARYREAVAPGSCLAISVLCRDSTDPQTLRIAEGMYDNSESKLISRTRAQVEQLFEGFRLSTPLADVLKWRNPTRVPASLRELLGIGLAGVGVKE